MWSWSIQASGTQAVCTATVTAALPPETIQMPDDPAPIAFPPEDLEQFEAGRKDALAQIAAQSAGGRIGVSVSGNAKTYSCTVTSGPAPAVDLSRLHPDDLAAVIAALTAAKGA